MDRNDLINASIANLTTLWKAAAAPQQGYFPGNDFDYCLVPGSDWPNKLWFSENIQTGTLERARIVCLSLAANMTVPVWQTAATPTQMFADAGFRLRFEQIGMSMQPDHRPQSKTQLRFERATTPAQFTAWTAIYPQAFGYGINHSVLEGAFRTIGFYLAFCGEVPVGTAMVCQTGKIFGVHGVGIVPDMRRRGFAAEIMEFLLDLAFESRAELVTLQASAMGRELYTKLGFQEDFILRTYSLQDSACT
ncbi:hypothetical protein C7T94_12665 [Pedobacter yulinensis]|uniref:N-acetyltransferase domain-containing protein n=1 Tax=Pedobacter yulinensis TaxID=2126353 RepID=A0A2T3HLX2_9SPHI|nr:GNAT family N-acetyltransferase [Pedobacter yulinensis]PST83413.1 hypothetical protein C7T94_12665 [Pedobacter yulinensis]